MEDESGYSSMSEPVTAYLPPSPSLEERLEDMRSSVKANDGEISDDTKEEIRTFFLVSQALIEERTGSLICSELLKSPDPNPELREYVMGEVPGSFSQTTRESLLFRGNAISGELYSKLQKVRGTRDDIAHDYNFHLGYEWEKIEERAELAVEAFNALIELNDDTV